MSKKCSHNWTHVKQEGSAVLWRCDWCGAETWIERSFEEHK